MHLLIFPFIIVGLFSKISNNKFKKNTSPNINTLKQIELPIQKNQLVPKTIELGECNANQSIIEGLKKS